MNLNFQIQIDPDNERKYFPIHLAAALGEKDCMNVLLQNNNICRQKIDIDQIDEETGTNAFWIAAYYGRG